MATPRSKIGLDEMLRPPPPLPPMLGLIPFMLGLILSSYFGVFIFQRKHSIQVGRREKKSEGSEATRWLWPQSENWPRPTPSLSFSLSGDYLIKLQQLSYMYIYIYIIT